MPPAIQRWRERVGWFLLRRQAGHSRPEVPFRWSTVRRVALLGLWDDDHAALLRFTESLRAGGKEVQLLLFVPKGASPSARPPSEATVVAPRDADFWGRPRRQSVERFVGRSYDVILNVARSDVFALHYLAGACRAPFKIGIARPPYDALYDVIIDVPPDHPLPGVFTILQHALPGLQKT